MSTENEENTENVDQEKPGFKQKLTSAVSLNPDQKKVFIVTLATVLLSGGGLGTFVDKLRTNEYDTKFKEVIATLQSNVSNAVTVNDDIAAKFKAAQEMQRRLIADNAALKTKLASNETKIQTTLSNSAAQGASIKSDIAGQLKSVQDALKAAQEMQRRLIADNAALKTKMTALQESVNNPVVSTNAPKADKRPIHTHRWGEWEKPQQIEGNFTTPQFFQYRKCSICGQADARSTW